MSEDLTLLLEEFAARYSRGERPEVRAYLERAGESREELARLLDRLLAELPAPDPAEETVALMAAWAKGEPPLLELRRRRGVKRAAIVDALVERLRLDKRKRDKVEGYVHELETGLLDPSPVDRRVFEIWADVLRARFDELIGWRPLAAEQKAAFFRLAKIEAEAFDAVPPPVEPERDEIDALFKGRV